MSQANATLASNEDSYVSCGKKAIADIERLLSLSHKRGMVGRKGCHIYLAPNDRPESALVWYRIKEPRKIKEQKSFDDVRGEAVHLGRHPHLNLSSMCRDELHYFGGAVRGKEYIHAVRGWIPRDLNELTALILAIKLGDLRICDARKYLQQRHVSKDIELPGSRFLPVSLNSFESLFNEFAWDLPG